MKETAVFLNEREQNELARAYGSETREFAIGFRTPPEDSKGANHVLEHSLLCGSEQYPLNDLMHILQNSSVAQEINAYTSED